MPFVLKKFKITTPKKIQQFLKDETNISLSFAQKLIAKGRVFDENNNRLQNSQTIKGKFIQVALFEGQTRGLKPIFTTDDFALFDKPSGIMVHPTSKDTAYTLLDEIRYHFGEDANLAHRIDMETSGLVLITRNKCSDITLKDMFENRQYQKEYLAIVDGQITKNISINSGIKKDTQSIIGVKMTTANDGKESLTIIEPISYDKSKDQTLVKAIPYTGRQHQIRVHLNSIGHKIVGDPIYGVDEAVANSYLTKTLNEKDRVSCTGYKRLLLHANKLSFNYNNTNYHFYSKLRLK